MAKKTKKIETPIDQRETFVSIQKSFADSDLSVEEKLKTLYELQQADTAIDKILQLRGELPLEVESLENEISELKGKSANISAQIEELNAKIAESKHNIVECESQLEKYRSQLDNVANSREYDSLNKEIENQDLLKAIAQKNIDESRTEIANKKSELEAIKEKMDVKNEDLKAKNTELATIVESTSAEVFAAIAMAFHLYKEDNEIHDFENTILTIHKESKSYSPWSSKIYTLRETPQVRRNK